jgi:succinoglycan biosynthesis transport protein ExoP
MSMELEPRESSSVSHGIAGLPGARLPLDAAESSRNGMLRSLTAVLRYKWMVLLVSVAGVAASVGLTRFVSPSYSAQALIWIEASRRDPTSEGPIRQRELLTSQSWIQLLRSFEVFDHVAITSGLYLTPAAPADSEALVGFSITDAVVPGSYRLDVLPQGGGISYSLHEVNNGLIERGLLGDSIGRGMGFLWQPTERQLAGLRTVSFTVRSPRDVARSLSQRVDARMDRAENFLAIELTDPDPALAARVINAAVERYVEVAGRIKREKLDVLTDILGEQLAIAQDNLHEAELALNEFRVRNVGQPTDRSPGGLAGSDDPVVAGYFRTRAEIEDIRRDREAIAAALARAPDGSVSLEALQMIPSVRYSSELIEAMRVATEKRAELRSLRFRYTDEFPLVRDALAELAELQNSTIPALGTRLMAELETREQELNSAAGSVSREMQQIPPRMIEEARLRRQVDIAGTLYSELQNRYESTRLAAVSTLPDVSVLDWARVPQQPSQDERTRLIMLAAMGSLGLALGLAVLRDRLDRRIRFPEQVTHELGLPILGVVPRLPRPPRNQAFDAEITEQILESFRLIRTNLLYEHGAAGPLVTTIPSTSVDDGKSFVSSQLGVTFAELGSRTLLIDGDMRRGVLHSLLQVDRKPGLTDVLKGEIPVEAAIRPTGIPNLDLLPSGTRYPDVAQLVNSAKVRQLLTQLRSKYTVILVDSPPVAAAVDALILATLSGNLVFTVRNGVTDGQMAEAKLNMVARLPIRLLGAILNDVPGTGSYRYYSYLPGYGPSDEASPDGEVDDLVRPLALLKSRSRGS